MLDRQEFKTCYENSEVKTIMVQNNGKDPKPTQIIAALLAIGLTGTFGLGALAIHQKFPGKLGVKVYDWFELDYKGVSEASIPR